MTISSQWTVPGEVVWHVSYLSKLLGEEFSSMTEFGCFWQSVGDTSYQVDLDYSDKQIIIRVHGDGMPTDKMYACVGYAAYHGLKWEAP
jgi:hypothetical protein